ncbi:MAG: hypothetical protein ACRESZ_03370, partial [Methylococcales bacterium]
MPPLPPGRDIHRVRVLDQSNPHSRENLDTGGSSPGWRQHKIRSRGFVALSWHLLCQTMKGAEAPDQIGAVD